MTTGRNSKKGVMLSLVVVLLLTLVVLFATDIVSTKNQFQSYERRAFESEKIGYYLDDVVEDIRTVTRIETPANSTNITIVDTLSINKTIFFSDYDSFLSNYSNTTGADFSINFSDPLTIIFDNDFVYQSAFSANGMFFYNASGPATVSEYRIKIISNTSATDSSFNFNKTPKAPPATFVELIYIDPDVRKTNIQSGFIDPTKETTAIIKFGASKRITVTFGLAESRINAVLINQTDVLAISELTINVNRTTKPALVATYNLPMNIILPTSNFTGNLPAN